MNCKINGVGKNLRYRILTINKQMYILDMGNALWKIIFPPFFWIFPNTIYEIYDNHLVEKIKTPAMEQKNPTRDSILAGTVAILLGNLLKPLVDFFDLTSKSYVNTIIVISIVLIVWSFYFYLNYRCKKSLYQVINLEKYPKKRLWVRPQSLKSFCFIIFYYLFFLAFTIFGFTAFIQFPNAMILIFVMIILFFTMLFSLMTVALGDNKVKFKKEKEAVFKENS